MTSASSSNGLQEEEGRRRKRPHVSDDAMDQTPPDPNVDPPAGAFTFRFPRPAFTGSFTFGRNQPNPNNDDLSEGEPTLRPPTRIAPRRNIGHHGPPRNFVIINNHYNSPSSSHEGRQLALMSYLQLFVLASLIPFILYLVYWFIQTFQNDVTAREEKALTEFQQRIFRCSQRYIENQCQPETRVPDMEKQCSYWERCMNKVPSVPGRTRLVAEILAEIANGLVDPMSSKTTLFILFVFLGVVFAKVYRRP